MTPPTVNFDRVARLYRWAEFLSFGPWLARCRNAQLGQLTAARHALVLGDGDGRFLAGLLAALPDLTADVVDSSQTMLHLLNRRLDPKARSRVSLHHADANAWNPGSARAYDLIVSHFFLDCFSRQELDRLFDRLLLRARPGAQWVLSEFAIPRNAFGALLARILIRCLYQAFGMLTGLPVRALPNYRAVLTGNGFVLRAERHFLGGLLCSQLWSLPISPADGAPHAPAQMI